MKPLCYAAALCLAAVPVTVAAPPPTPKATTYKEKILGVWKAVKLDGVNLEGGIIRLPWGLVVEFARGGKMKATIAVEGHNANIEGTYSINGNKVKVISDTNPWKTHVSATFIIAKLREGDLHLKNEGGKIIELKRKKK